jgi:hypothetical protein
LLGLDRSARPRLWHTVSFAAQCGSKARLCTAKDTDEKGPHRNGVVTAKRL